MGKYIQRITYQFDSKELLQNLGNPPPKFIFELFESLISLKKVEGFGIGKSIVLNA